MHKLTSSSTKCEAYQTAWSRERQFLPEERNQANCTEHPEHAYNLRYSVSYYPEEIRDQKEFLERTPKYATQREGKAYKLYLIWNKENKIKSLAQLLERSNF